MERIAEKDYIKLLTEKLHTSYELVEMGLLLFGRNFNSISQYIHRRKICC
jgi:hypothetical protein